MSRAANVYRDADVDAVATTVLVTGVGPQLAVIAELAEAVVKVVDPLLGVMTRLVDGLLAVKTVSVVATSPAAVTALAVPAIVADGTAVPLEGTLRADPAPKSSSFSTNVVTASSIAGSIVCNTEHRTNLAVRVGVREVSCRCVSTSPEIVHPGGQQHGQHLTAC